MKKIFRNIMTIAAFSAVIASCAKDDAATKLQGEKVNITITASSERTKTVYNPADKSISWGDPATESLKVLEQAVASGETKTTVDKDATCTSVTDGVAEFSVTFDAAPGAAEYKYLAVHPSTAWCSWAESSKYNLDQMPVVVPKDQTPTATSFDPAADVFLSMVESKTSQPNDLDFRFARVVALIKMQFTGLPNGTVSKVTLTSTPASTAALNEAGTAGIAGIMRVNTSTLEPVVTGEVQNTVTLNYSSLNVSVTDGTLTSIFSTYPFSLAEGETMKVAVTYSDGSVYKRTLTAPAEGLKFNMGKIRPVTVDMSKNFSQTINLMDCVQVAGTGLAQDANGIGGFDAFNKGPQCQGFYFNVNNVPEDGKYLLTITLERTSGAAGNNYYGRYPGVIFGYLVNSDKYNAEIEYYDPIVTVVETDDFKPSTTRDLEFEIDFKQGNNTIRIKPEVNKETSNRTIYMTFRGFTVTNI